ncbi:MAG: translational activator of GCN4 [Icmadophila ericetorum]|nr:translational activator of GCN4 [Icmadophila ericetorum]
MEQVNGSRGTSEYLESLSNGVRTSSTAVRKTELQSLRPKVIEGDLGEQALEHVLTLLLTTYPAYHDQGSRRAVQDCFQVIWEASTKCFAKFVAFLKAEATKPAIAPTSAFVLTEWCSRALQLCASNTKLWDIHGGDLISADAQLLDLCVSYSARGGIKQSALVVTRRALRQLFKNPEHGDTIIKSVVLRLSGKGHLGSKSALLLGTVAGVCSRLTGKKSVLESLKDQYLAFWIREIVGSRSVVPDYIAYALGDFFSDFVTEQDLQTSVVPALEKALLRAPEVVLINVLRPVFSSLPHTIDLSGILANRLLKPLLSNLKSTNAEIRKGVVSAFAALTDRSHDEEMLKKVTSDILTPLVTAKIPVAEQRVLHAQLLSLLPLLSSCSISVCNSLPAVANKEANEAALVAEAGALTRHLSFLIASNSSNLEGALKAYATGLSDKKLTVQRIWSLSTGDLFWQIYQHPAQSPSNLQAIEAVLPKLLNIFNDVVANPIQAAQSGLVVAGFVVVSLYNYFANTLQEAPLKSALAKAKVYDLSLAISPKPGFLLNHKIYSKFSSQEDFTWALRAITSCSSKVRLTEEPSATSDAWTQAFLFFLTASFSPANARRDAMTALEAVYLNNPGSVGKLIIRGLWLWYRHVETSFKDSAALAAQTGTNGLHLAIRSICPPASALGTIEPAVIRTQLVQMLVLCRPEVLPRVSWIEVCLRMGQDPGNLVRDYKQQCMDQVINILENEELGLALGTVREAAYNTFAELAFVAPDVIIPSLVQIVALNLSTEEIRRCGPTDFAIARTPEGATYVDVLSVKSQNQILDKNAKDYDTLKWEEELRSQLTRKKGQEKRLTPDEQAKVNIQLVKEAKIREDVLGLERKLRRGIGIISGLARGPPTDADLWMGPSLRVLLDVVKAGAGLLLGDAVETVYIQCAEFVSTRLGSLRPFIGIATLRALGSTNLPPDYEQESLGDSITRILYRLRLAGEQRPFDNVSLNYILPLVNAVLEQHGIGHSGVDERDEQITLALDFLTFHSDNFSQSSLPRGEMISVLVHSMQAFSQHYKLIKDCLLDFCRVIGPNAASSEISTLLKGAIVPQTSVRTAVLLAIRAEIDLTELDFSEEIWLARHDMNDENSELGTDIWQENALEVEGSDALKMLPYLASPDRALRLAASRAVATCVAEDATVFGTVLDLLQSAYREKAKVIAPERDEYGLPKKTDLNDPWEARSGVALAFRALAPRFDPERLVSFVQFLIDESAVGDRNAAVRDEMIESATAVIAVHGGKKLEELMAIFEGGLEASDKDIGVSDLVSEAVIILYGALARHLQLGDERVPKVVQRLLLTLSTPSETVQYAVAGCLPPLIRISGSQTSEYVQQVLEQLFQSKKYAARRGAAYGLAGIVSGKGIIALREYRIMSSLKSAIENKKDPNQRQGALFAYELLSLILGRTFEPYIIQIVPQLLSSFGDTSADVREACLDAAKACFASLSSYGVKNILPTLLDGLEEPQWRSKKGACDLLGAMAYLDPQQLASSLPDIIPPLTNVLNDSHKEVRSSANRSLQRFGEVISNPEIKGLVGILLKALSDPTKFTDDALDALIKVSFTHYLDAPSLALVVRILERGLGDRSATKRKSSQIIGSLAHLTERKDLISHLPILVAGLKLAVVDPVPTTRATASKALGSLVEKLGEDALPDLIPGLMSTLKSEAGAGDRLGSAQALSEVLAGLGTGRLEETLPTILQNVSSSKPTVREGFMSLFIYLPACFGNSFSAYLSRIIPSILSGLADEVDSIRDTSLRAGRLLVKNFATKAIDLLLPELDRGLSDDNYRIRLSSVELVGDLLFNLTGISGKTDQDDDEETGATEAGQSLLEALGEEKRNRILSSLYICRCDTSGLVRTAAINVWKALVATPRTLKELIPTLTQLLIRRLASSNMEQKVIAGNALGELIRKAGEGVLATLLPTLEEGLQTSTDSDNKQGICIALREIISSASPETLEDYEKTLISVVRTALVDSDDDVRETAAEAFDSLQRIFGKRAVDQVLPYILNLLRTDGEAETALAALLTLLEDNTRSNIILPNLVPTLLTSPITAFNARAIASLSQVAGSVMTRRLPAILNSLMDNIVACKDDELRGDLEAAFDAVLLSVDEFDGLNTAMSVMLALMKHDDHRRRAIAHLRLSKFFLDSEVDYSRYNPDLIRVLLLSFDDRDREVIKMAWTALSELTKRLKKEEMESLVSSTRQVLQQVGVAGHDLPGFSLPKGINAILPIFLQGLMNGTAEQRTQSALAISDIIDRTSKDALKPFVTQITGPLIRVVSERSVDLKCAILLTLNNLLEKIPQFLKPFLPQLQRTFAKSLADTTSELLRSRAAKALGTLITLAPRIDPLIAELVTGTKTPDAGVRNAMLKALFEVVSKSGANMSEASRVSILGLIDSDLTDTDPSMTITNARLLGALIKNIPSTEASSLIKQRVLTTHFSNSSVLSLNAVLLESADSVLGPYATETPSTICQGIESKNNFVTDNCVLAAGKYLLHAHEHLSANLETSKRIFGTLANVIQPGQSIDSRRLALVVIRTVSRQHHKIVEPNLSLLAPPIFASVRDPVIPIKLAAEAAFLALFQVVEKGSTEFDAYISGGDLNAGVKRSMQDYFKRVAMRLGAQARERKEAEGGQGGLGLSGDEVEDEREIWSVGKVNLGENAFSED